MLPSLHLLSRPNVPIQGIQVKRCRIMAEPVFEDEVIDLRQAYLDALHPGLTVDERDWFAVVKRAIPFLKSDFGLGDQSPLWWQWVADYCLEIPQAMWEFVALNTTKFEAVMYFAGWYDLGTEDHVRWAAWARDNAIEESRMWVYTRIDTSSVDFSSLIDTLAKEPVPDEIQGDVADVEEWLLRNMENMETSARFLWRKSILNPLNGRPLDQEWTQKIM